MPLASPVDWSEFRLDTPEGFGLVRPRFFAEFVVEYPTPATVLGFYQHVLNELDESLRFVDTGSGRWSKRSARTDKYLATWCQNPVFWPKKNYCLIMQDVDQGIGDTELTVYYAARERTPPDPVWFQKIVESDIRPPVYSSRLIVSFPVDHPLVTSLRVVDWVADASALHDASFISGAAGYAVDVPLNPPDPRQGPAARARGGALLQRHPGLTCVSHLPVGTELLKWDREYVLSKGAAIPRPYVKRANWITMLNVAQVEILGGLDALRAMLGVMPGISIERRGAAFIVRAGERPQLGDISLDNIPAEYRVATRAIKDFTLPMRDIRPELGQAFDEYGFQVWYDALAKP